MSDMWHVRGVTAEAQRAAKVIAAERGMAIGKWLNELILAIAAAPRLDPYRPKISETEKAEEFLVAPEYPCGPEQIATALKATNELLKQRTPPPVIHKRVQGTFINSEPRVVYETRPEDFAPAKDLPALGEVPAPRSFPKSGKKGKFL